MKISFWVYVVMDARNTHWIGLTGNINTIMHMDGLQDGDGNELVEEMKAYLVPAWCMEHGLRCIVTVRTVDVEFPD